MIIQESTIERIKNINWFNNVEHKITSTIHFKIEHTDNWVTSSKNCSSIVWENTTLKQISNLRGYLSKHESYRLWNQILKEGKVFIDEHIKPKILKYITMYNLSDNFIHDIEWNLLGFILEDTYKKILNDSNTPIFFTNLLKIYENGNLPCGCKVVDNKITIIVI